MRERRQFERRPSSIQVKVSHPSFGVIIGSTTDISDGGAHVRLDAMRVMHASKNAVGLMFVPRH